MLLQVLDDMLFDAISLEARPHHQAKRWHLVQKMEQDAIKVAASVELVTAAKATTTNDIVAAIE
jgi:hypothetical protein